jgi:folate-binding protein YgfZ
MAADEPGRIARLPHLGLLRFSGADAVEFLQGQLSNDIRRLAAGTSLLAAYSSPQGRVIAVLHLIPTAAGVLAVLPRELVEPVRDRLRKFVMRSKVLIETLTGRPPAGPGTPGVGTDAGSNAPAVSSGSRSSAPAVGSGAASSAPAVGSGSGSSAPAVGSGEVGSNAPQSWVVAGQYSPGGPVSAGVTELDGVILAPVVAGGARRWVIGSVAALDALATGADTELEWRLADIRAGLPQIYAATTETFVAQMLNLDLIDGISFSKGCYTGQEIIARTQHLGRIKRRLYRLALPPGDWQVGQPLQLRDGRRGRLTEVVRGPAAVEALAVLPLDAKAEAHSEDPGGAADVAAQELPLPYAITQPESAGGLSA